MTLITRFTVTLSLLAAATVTPFVAASPNQQHGCQQNEFWYSERSCCLPHGGHPSPPPPSGRDCPGSDDWYWHSGQACCVPRHPSHTPPTCDNGWDWDDGDNCCKPPTCGNNEFWYPERSCCVPNGGTHSSPPPGRDCPHNGWYWHTGQGCCIPRQPSHPPPNCDNSWNWDNDDQCCRPPPPRPSGYYHNKRSATSRSASLCPSGLQACPISGLAQGGDYECLDTTTELESCGGCVSLGQGQDCTAIEGVWNLGCEMGTCVVYTCAAGYRPAPDRKSCIAL